MGGAIKDGTKPPINTEIIRGWYNESIEYLDYMEYVEELNKMCYSTIYKGFKIRKTSDTKYELFDCRFHNYYPRVSDHNLSILLGKGFIRGVNYIQFKRYEETKKWITKHLKRLRKLKPSKFVRKSIVRFKKKLVPVDRVLKRYLRETKEGQSP